MVTNAHKVRGTDQGQERDRMTVHLSLSFGSDSKRFGASGTGGTEEPGKHSHARARPPARPHTNGYAATLCPSCPCATQPPDLTGKPDGPGAPRSVPRSVPDVEAGRLSRLTRAELQHSKGRRSTVRHEGNVAPSPLAGGLPSPSGEGPDAHPARHRSGVYELRLERCGWVLHTLERGHVDQGYEGTGHPPPGSQISGAGGAPLPRYLPRDPQEWAVFAEEPRADRLRKGAR